jgi:hypothetical protein
VQNNSTTIETWWPAHTVTFSKDRWLGAYSIGLTIPWKLSCPMRNVMKLKENKLAAVLGTAELVNCFYMEAKNVTINCI